jgi:hypothetical protein
MGKKKLEQFIHHEHLDELRQSAEEGCHFCTLLWCTAEHERFKGRLQDSSDLDMTTESEKTGVLLQISVDTGGSGAHKDLHVHIQVNKGLGEPLDMNSRSAVFLKFFPASDDSESGARVAEWEKLIGAGHEAQDSVSTRSESSFALARHWLSACLHDHEACQQECNSVSTIPSRLIDVGSAPHYDTVRLRSRDEFEKKPAYLTLSHCWGGADILRLLSSNTELFFESIPTEKLPKNFVDAIEITRHLGYQYLWIDSLCIVQNSAPDWESESAVMGEIYRGSTCTISALGAENSHDGCFTRRNPLIYRPCILSGDSSAGVVAEGRYLPEEWRGWGQSEDIGKLHSRGWVVQERILSPRTLHYGAISMSWECIEHDATERQPDGNGYGLPDGGWTFRTYRRPKEAFHNSNPPAPLENGTRPQNEQFKEFFDAWSSVLTAYSQCSLTKGSDKLIAVNGLMDRVSQRTGLTPIAGLWSEYILPGLMWHTYGPELMLPETRCPTWSWAAVDTPIVFTYKGLVITGRNENTPINLGMPGVYHYMPFHMKYDLTWKTKVLGGKLSVASNGAVMGNGYLVVRGPCKKINLNEIEYDSRFPYQHNPQARHKSSRFIPDTTASTPEYWALLLARGVGSSNIRDARVDVGLIIEPGIKDKSICRRYGYYEQAYWRYDDYVWFAKDEEESVKTITIF